MGLYGKGKHNEETPRIKPHVKKSDTVVILSGKDRGKQGKVLRVNASKGTAIVERVNLHKKHTRANPQQNRQAGIIESEAPIRMSNLQVICPSCGEASRTGSHRTADGAKRFCRKCETEM